MLKDLTRPFVKIIAKMISNILIIAISFMYNRLFLRFFSHFLQMFWHCDIRCHTQCNCFKLSKIFDLKRVERKMKVWEYFFLTFEGLKYLDLTHVKITKNVWCHTYDRSNFSHENLTCFMLRLSRYTQNCIALFAKATQNIFKKFWQCYN